MTAAARTDSTRDATQRRWLWIIGIWTAYGLLVSGQHHLSYLLSRGVSLPWSLSILLQLPLYWCWALVTPGILWLGRRFPFVPGQRVQSLAVHALACLAFVAFIDVGYAWHSANVLGATAVPLARRAAQLFASWVLADGLYYWTILSVNWAVDHQRRLRERELTASQLETQLAQADLHALKQQLHPHFLFNALHTIGSLVRTGDRDNAVRVVAGLGDLLRRLLDGAAQQEVPLRQELEFARHYLEIEQVRFSDRLRVEIVADSDVLDASVPHLILQPLVENAIQHGIAPHRAAGLVRVGARRVGTRLELVVRDDGPGTGNGRGGARSGIGLANTRARLERLYDGDFELVVGNGAGGGHEARVVLPLRPAPAHELLR